MRDRRVAPPPSDRLEAAIRELMEALREQVRTEVREEIRARTTGPARLLGIEAAAEACGVGRTAMYDLIGKGAVRSLKVGRRRLVAEVDLQEYIDRLRSERP